MGDPAQTTGLWFMGSWVEVHLLSLGFVYNTTDAPWGIISVKSQHTDHELPMNPITMMRNALGREHGGSGVPLLAEEYAKSVEFWSQYATIK